MAIVEKIRSTVYNLIFLLLKNTQGCPYGNDFITNAKNLQLLSYYVKIQAGDFMYKILEELDSVTKESKITLTSSKNIPNRNAVIKIIKDMHELMFPLYFNSGIKRDREDLLDEITSLLCKQINVAFKFSLMETEDRDICGEFIGRIPYIYSMLLKDIEALYNGDPAAKSREEVIISYPGFYAISIYRMAHELYELNVPLIPRIMTEYAHQKTGVDINAGAKIGEYFFIDHATGIVIGETTTIGNNVKLYQGVTLGAKSFETDEKGNPVKGIKRHPDIGNNVVIYANQLTRSGFPAMQKTAETILVNHRAKEADDMCMSIKEIINLIPEE